MQGYGTIDRDYGVRLATWSADADDGVYMLNLMKYRDEADYGPGGETGVSGREADDRYAPLDVLAAIGASVCLVADVVDATEDWDRVAVVRYANRPSFVQMQDRPDFQERHVHKAAGMDRTTIVGTVPVDGLPDGGGEGGTLLLELWQGGAPPPIAVGPTVAFDVEGTIVGDGRHWDGGRYTRVAEVPDLPDPSPAHQVVVLRPALERWS